MSETIHATNRARRAIVIGFVLSAGWLLAVVLFFLFATPGGADGLTILPAIMVVLAVVGPIGLIASVSVASAMVAQSAQVRDLTTLLAQSYRRPDPQPEPARPDYPDPSPALDRMGDELSQITARLSELEHWLAQRAGAIDAADVAMRAVPMQGSGAGDLPPNPVEDMPELALADPNTDNPVPLDTFIKALEFPADPDDAAGFDALRAALRHHQSAQLITAAQDVLTLLSQDGLYMDDLTPDRARVDLWRRFADGERGGAVAQVGGIRDDDAVDLCIARMRQDTIFRDAVHHFLRLFDHQFAEIAPDATDPQVAALSETRSARAFMLLGRAAGIFHE